MLNIFETHAHLDFTDFDDDRDDLIKKCEKAGIKKIINVGVDIKSSYNSINLANKYSQIKATAGFHPSSAQEYDEVTLRELINDKNIVAVGEIGLDYYRMNNTKELQQKIFEEQIKLALEYDKPIIIHDREAHEDCFNILSKYKPKKVVFHCFSGNYQFANKIFDMGWFISFTGAITYPKNEETYTILQNMPKNRLFIETDCPYLSPVPNRGKRNTPINLQIVIEKIADIVKATPKNVADTTYENAINFFEIKE